MPLLWYIVNGYLGDMMTCIMSAKDVVINNQSIIINQLQSIAPTAEQKWMEMETMTNEYIRKRDVIELWNRCNPFTAVKAIEFGVKLKKLKPADATQIRYSRWIKTEDGAECEKCGREAVYQIVDDHWEYEPFCPHCGAIMNVKE